MAAREGARSIEARRVAAAQGFIVSVYDLDLAPLGERVLLLPIRIGRSSLNDICVSHRLVSEFHARIEELDGRLCVRDLSSKNGVLLETVGSDGAARVPPQTPIDLEPYGYEFLLSPLLRVRVRPATEALDARHSHALGSVLGAGLGSVVGGAGRHALGSPAPGGGFGSALGDPSSALAEDQLTEGFVHREAGSPPAAARPSAQARGSAQPSPSPAAHATASHGAAGGVHQPSAHQSSVPPAPSPARVDAASGRSPPRPARSVLSQTAQQGSPPSFSADGMRANAPAPVSGLPSLGVSPAVQPYSSVFIEPAEGSLELPPLPQSVRAPERARPPSAPPVVRATLLEPAAEAGVPHLVQTAWEVGPGTLPAAAAQSQRPAEPAARSLEALALRGLRELAASLVPGQSLDSASDVVQLVTKLHDAVEMFCRCFVPVREACSRFVPSDELERAAIERCRNGSPAYVAVERALEPRAVAAALLDWRSEQHDAPRAVEHILADLMLHHLALSQAALEGTRALLDELSPARIESARPAPAPTLFSRLGLADTREKESWEAFTRRHAELEAVGRTFRTLFGDSFTRAYLAHLPTRGSGPSL